MRNGLSLLLLTEKLNIFFYSQDGWYSEGYDYQGVRVDDSRIYSDTEYYPTTATIPSKRKGKILITIYY